MLPAASGGRTRLWPRRVRVHVHDSTVEFGSSSRCHRQRAQNYRMRIDTSSSRVIVHHKRFRPRLALLAAVPPAVATAGLATLLPAVEAFCAPPVAAIFALRVSTPTATPPMPSPLPSGAVTICAGGTWLCWRWFCSGRVGRGEKVDPVELEGVGEAFEGDWGMAVEVMVVCLTALLSEPVVDEEELLVLVVMDVNSGGGLCRSIGVGTRS